MDRLTQLRGEAGGSRDSSLDTSVALSEAYVTANESSKFFSLSEEDSSFDISPIKDVSLASTAAPEKPIAGNEQLISNLSPIPKKNDLLDSYKFGKQIEAANILSGGVDIFDDNDNSYDGDELVIDDNVEEIDDKSNSELKLIDNTELPKEENEEIGESLDNEQAIASKDTEVVLQIDGKNVNAIDIGNGLYLYRRAGEEELAAVQIVADDGQQQQPSFKFLKVRENAEGNLEVYEEIEVEVPKEVPIKEEKIPEKNVPHVPIKDISKVISDPTSNKVTEKKKSPEETLPTTSRSEIEDFVKIELSDTKSEVNLNSKMMKYNETRKSPVIHSTPNKEGIPLTKTMVDMQLHPNRHLDNVKTIEVHTDSSKQKATDTQIKNKDSLEDNKVEKTSTKEKENSSEKLVPSEDSEQEKDKLDKLEVDSQKENIGKEVLNVQDLKDMADCTEDIIPSGDIQNLNSEAKIVGKEENTQPIIQEIKTQEVSTQDIDIIEVDKIFDLTKQTNNKEVKEDRISDNIKDVNKDQLSKSPDVAGLKDPVATENRKIQQSGTTCSEIVGIDDKELQTKSISDTTNKIINDQPTEKIGSIDKANKQETESKEKSLLEIVNIKPNLSRDSITKVEVETNKGSTGLIKKTESGVKEKVNFQTEIRKKNEVSAETNKTIGKVKEDKHDAQKETEIIEIKQSKLEKKFVDISKEQVKNKQDVVIKPINSSVPKKIEVNETVKLKEDIKRTQADLAKNFKSYEINVNSKVDVKKEVTKPINSEHKPINNNHAAVPFGQWTSANRQEFLNKIKEAKIPINTSNSNTKSLKQANDLNRRDVLQKIDSQRQSNNASSKIQEHPKLNVKTETITFTNKPLPVRDNKVPVKTEAPPPVLKTKPALPQNSTKSEFPEMPKILPAQTAAAVSMVSKEENPQRQEINNQDLIDKTIEGIINKNNPKSGEAKPETVKPKGPQSPSSLDAIEMKMNELHGIPFIERPPHELPRVYNRDVKTYAKADSKLPVAKVSKIPNLVPFANTAPLKLLKETVIDLDSEEEVIEHEPITGDIELPKRNIVPKLSATLPVEAKVVKRNTDVSKKETIITENDFEKFARRNSITYENCLTVNFEGNKQHNVIQSLVEKDTISKNPRTDVLLTESKSRSLKPKSLRSNYLPNQIQITSKLMPVDEELFNKNYHSKLQLAYQTAMTAKRQMESPITIIEDKPVKVVFMDPNVDFPSSPLNVQRQELSPTKSVKPVKESDTLTTSTCDSLDSDVLDGINESKVSDESKIKTKHQRKQVLTPVETPELELIVPADLGVAISPKKKRRTEEFKTDRSPKSVVPKKSYLLGRSTVADPISQDLTRNVPNELANQSNLIINHKDAASAIDNLVKAAELLETQSESINASNSIASSNASPQTTTPKRGRGRPRKYPLPDSVPDQVKLPSPQKKPRLIDAKQKQRVSTTEEDDTSDDEMLRENWTMGKINENIVCPICSKLFRSENVVFKHVKHCTGPSPNRSESDKRSPRRSRLSRDTDSKSLDDSDDMNVGLDKLASKKNTPKKRKSKESSDSKEDVIVIEDTPIKEKVEKVTSLKQHEPRKSVKTKAQYKTSSLSCEHCGKTFRQLSYLVNHKLIHKKETSKSSDSDSKGGDKSVFSCEVCKKEFRKLHHLVQHRLIHNQQQNVVPRPSRKSSSEQSSDIRVVKDSKQTEDQSAAFRCEPCDKSFRKLHHLVEHRETHDGINRQKITSSVQPTVEKVLPNPPPQCDVCKKTFRKLHHLIEHKEQHLETSSEKSDDKSVKSSLSTRDIIHECPLCYMVFPNEHSLTKHSVICQRKKRQSAMKQAAKALEEVTEEDEVLKVNESKTEQPIVVENKETAIVLTSELKKVEEPAPIKDKRPSKEEEMKPKELLLASPKKRDLEEVACAVVEVNQGTPQKIKKLEEKTEEESKATNISTKKKIVVKDKEEKKEVVNLAKPRKSNLPLAVIKAIEPVESSDDDEIRYMLNPDFKDEHTEGKMFMKVRAKKRNSLQFERPNSKDLVQRRTSLQHPPKVTRLKSKSVDNSDVSVIPPNNTSKVANLELVPSIDSDDSDVKYSFPEPSTKTTKSDKSAKGKKKVIAVKRKSVSNTSRRKSSGKSVAVKHKEKTSPEKPIKRRRIEVEHRCDCGQLFNSAALLARHTSLAHTPPRVRRRRVESPTPVAAPKPSASTVSAPRNTNKSVDSRKSSVRGNSGATAKPGRSPGKATGKTPTRKSVKGDQGEPRRVASAKGRKMTAHRGVPVPEKMKHIADKLRK